MPQRPTVRRRTTIFIGIGALVVGAGIGAAGHSTKANANAAAGSPAGTSTKTATATATVTATTTAHSNAAAAAPAPATVTVTAAAKAPPPAATAPATSVVFSTSGNGIKQTKSFTTGADWAVAYTFDCSSSLGGKGNFILSEDDGITGTTFANALAAKGSDTSYAHDDPGQHYLSVDSECDWTIKVTNG